VELPDRLRWVTSGRFLRPFSAFVAAVIWALVLYNATVVDRVPPSVTIRLSPPASSGNLASTLSSIDVVFNEDVVPATAKNAFAISPYVAGTFHWQGTTMLIFTPSSKLPLDATFHVHVGPGIADKAGNIQRDAYDLTFTTVGSPSVTSVAPVRDAKLVDLDSSITITFDRLMDIGTVPDGLVLNPPFAYEPSWQGEVLTLKPERPLSPSTTYNIKIGSVATDGDGNALLPYQWSFQTIAIGLRPRQLVPAADSEGVSVRTPIAIVFDGPIDKTSIAGAISLQPAVTGSIEVRSLPSDQGPAAQPTSGQEVAGDNALVFTPDAPLQANTTYVVTLGAGVRHLDGRAAGARTWSFSTGEPTTSAINRILFLSDRSGVLNVWMMNDDGSGQRQVTAELAPVVGFDVNAAGDKIAFATAGQVKRMSINGDNLQTTAGDAREYAPAFTPDGTGLVVARRDASGNDLGYYRIPLISGSDERQLLPDGAPQLGSDQIGDAGVPASLHYFGCDLRQAFSDDSAWMLLARADGNALELVEMNGGGRITLGLTARSRPVWNAVYRAFYVVASEDGGTTWGYWRIDLDGTRGWIGTASGDLTVSSKGAVVQVAAASDGVGHLFFRTAPVTAAEGRQLTLDAAWSERWPSFSPDGAQIVFGRLNATTPQQSGGIWIMKPDDATPTVLSPDGICPRFVP
jgi:hypothetical protein